MVTAAGTLTLTSPPLTTFRAQQARKLETPLPSDALTTGQRAELELITRCIFSTPQPVSEGQVAPARTPTAVEAHRQLVARESLEWLAGMEGPLHPEDQPRLDRLQETLGRPFLVIPDPDDPGREKVLDCRLTVEGLNSEPEQVKHLAASLAVMLEATEHEPTRVRLGEIELCVRNTELATHLRPAYSAGEFENLVSLCRERGVFDVEVHPETGLIATSGGEENHEMAARQWVTDTIRCGELEREQAPEGWVKALTTLSKFYTGPQERAAFEKAIADPESYRRGGPEEGVAHIFYPQTTERDPSWFNNKRLESHGLALEALCDAIANHDQAWGFKEVPQEAVESIALLANYFLAIDYPTAPSAGNWEETPFEGGLTWDTQAIKGGLESLKDLLFDPRHEGDPVIGEVRRRMAGAPHGEKLSARHLEDGIRAGEARLRETFKAESPGHREMDSSLVFLSQTDLCLHDDPVEDARRHLAMLGAVEASLVRDGGMIRYAPFSLELKDGTKVGSPDSYLTLNYNCAVDKDGKLNLEWKKVMDSFGSKDASEPEVFSARAALSTPDSEAEWFMVSDLAHGYARQAEKLLETGTPEALELLPAAVEGATRNINRAYARITDEGRTKANGEASPGWAVPEAYQHVTSLWGDRESRTVAGVNTPLTWASASLAAASRAYATLLDKLESSRP